MIRTLISELRKRVDPSSSEGQLTGEQCYWRFLAGTMLVMASAIGGSTVFFVTLTVFLGYCLFMQWQSTTRYSYRRDRDRGQFGADMKLFVFLVWLSAAILLMAVLPALGLLLIGGGLAYLIVGKDNVDEMS